MSYRESLRLMAFDSHGVITTYGAAQAGVPSVEVRKLAARGALTRTGHGVYRMTEAPTDDLTPYAEAVALVGPDAVIADESVLDMHDLAFVNPAHIVVATPHRVRAALPDTIRVLKQQVAPRTVEYVHGVPAMPLAQALVRCADRVMTERLEDAVVEALARRLLSADEGYEVRTALAAGAQASMTLAGI